MKTRKVTLCALLAALAIIFGYIESLFPLPVPVPGVKLGLGNIVILICLYSFDKKITWFVMLIKVIITSLLFSAPSALLYSMCGGVLSLLVMSLMKNFKFHIYCVSIGGGISHNLGQLFMASLIMKNINTLFYFPVLIFSGTVVAFVTGIAAKIVIKHIKLSGCC